MSSSSCRLGPEGAEPESHLCNEVKVLKVV